MAPLFYVSRACNKQQKSSCDVVPVHPVADSSKPAIPEDCPDHRTVPLEELARRIRVGHQTVQVATANALAAALDVGDALIEARDRVSTNWERWLQANCPFGVSTARLYAQLARGRAMIEAEIDRVGGLSLRAARRLVSTAKTSEEDGEESEPAPIETKPMSADPLAFWNALPSEQKQQILDHEGRAGLAALMSPALLVDLTNHLIKLDVSVASDAGPLAVQLTKMLRRALFSTDKAAAATLDQMFEKLNSNGRGIHDIAVALVDNRKKMKQRSNKATGRN